MSRALVFYAKQRMQQTPAAKVRVARPPRRSSAADLLPVRPSTRLARLFSRNSSATKAQTALQRG